MLLLHHGHHQNGAPTWTCTTNLLLRREACIYSYTLGAMASVIGLAPIRPDLKGRLLELVCIHGRNLAPRRGAHGVAAHGQALTLWTPILHGGD